MMAALVSFLTTTWDVLALVLLLDSSVVGDP